LIQQFTLEHRQLKEGSEKYRKMQESKLIKEIEKLKFYIRLNQLDMLQEDKKFDLFLTEILFLLPDNFLIKDFLLNIFIHLEVENSDLEIFQRNCDLKKSIYLSNNKEEINDETLIVKDKRKAPKNEISIIEKRDLGFKNIKEKINNSNIYKTNDIQRSQDLTKIQIERKDIDKITPSSIVSNIYIFNSETTIMNNSQSECQPIINNSFPSNSVQINSSFPMSISSNLNSSQNNKCIDINSQDKDTNTFVNKNSSSNLNYALLSSNYKSTNFSNIQPSVTSDFDKASSRNETIRTNINNLHKKTITGINSRLNSNQILYQPQKQKKNHSIRPHSIKKNNNKAQVLDHFFNRCQNKIGTDEVKKRGDSVEEMSQKLQSKDMEKKNFCRNAIKNKGFYEINDKIASPIYTNQPTYSKRKLSNNDKSSNSNLSILSKADINSENIIAINSNSNLRDKYNIFNKNTKQESISNKEELSFAKHNKQLAKEGKRKNRLSVDAENTDYNLIILSQDVNSSKQSSRFSADDSILVKGTPTKNDEILKFRKRSPNLHSKSRQMLNLLNQIKKEA
jgi:hypothetical protein